MRKSYLGEWLLILACVSGAAEWIVAGRAVVRRTLFPASAIPESSRTESSFMAVLLPHVASAESKRSMSASAAASFLDGLKAAGCVSIRLEDVEDFYARGRLLPPRAVLVAFAEDDLKGVARADAALRDARWRGVLFITGVETPSANDAGHRLLTEHAVRQMQLENTWEFGAISATEPPTAAAGTAIRALLDDDGTRLAPRRPGRFPLRFTASELGYNDERDAPSALHMLAVRPERSAQENLRVVANAWPRKSAFSDDFASDGVGTDWIAGWGSVSIGAGRLALLPTPRQTGAAAFLRGTEKWRDVVLEFDLKKYQKEFWAYARWAENGSYVRVGVRGGYWYVEQKIGAKNLPTMLARAPITEGSLPAHVRFVLKGGSAIVHVNGRMQFGRALRVNPAVEQGRVLLGVYDARQRSAFAVLTKVAARPADSDWISWKPGRAGFDEDHLEDLREQSVYARAISPRWISVAADGKASVEELQGGLTRSLAGFYSCRLVPMAQLPSAAAWPDAVADRLTAGLNDAVRDLGATGLNLRVSAAALARPDTSRLLAKLRAGFSAAHRELWLTVDGTEPLDPAVIAEVDGVLRPAKSSSFNLELLQATRVRSTPRLKRETASNQ